MTAEAASSSSSLEPARNKQGADKTSDVDYQHLPERVKRAIRHQQDASEILIGWVQLAVVGLYSALLYLLSPKTFTSEAAFAPVPWVLGGYLAFSSGEAGRRPSPVRAPDWLALSLGRCSIWGFCSVSSGASICNICSRRPFI